MGGRVADARGGDWRNLGSFQGESGLGVGDENSLAGCGGGDGMLGG